MIKTYAWYFPNWHPTPLNDKWHGTGWTEWECVKCAMPRFPGHIQPKKPLWGFENEADPAVFEKKIDTAKKYGIDGFIFDFYWFKDLGPYRRECLDNGFLQAKNSQELEFSVMWCNHDPIYAHPAAYRHDNFQLASGDIDEKLFTEVTDFCIKNYFGRQNYQRVDGKIHFGIWHMKKFIDNFGSPENAAKILSDFRTRAFKQGYELHITTQNFNFPGFGTNKDLCDTYLKILGIDSFFSYNWKNCSVNPSEWPVCNYADFRRENVELYKTYSEFSSVPLSITVSTGWDSSPRTVQSDMYENVGYPFCPIVKGNTPEEVEISFKEAKKFIESDKHTGKFFTISTWNEWTEGNYLEPDEENGFGYLEAYKKVFVK